MTATLPSDTHSVDDTGHTTDHNDLVDCVSVITGSSPGDSVTVQKTMNTLAGAVTSGQFLRGNDTDVVMAAIEAGDLPAGTTSAQGAVELASATPAAVSTAGAAGSSGKASDGSHVHLGFFGGIFGTGSDGAVTLDGSTTYNSFSSLSGSTYTLTRDVQATSFTVNNGVTLKTSSYRIFCQGTFTNNGTVSNAGNNASGSTQGGAGTNASFTRGQSGGAGGSGVSGTGANGTAANMGAAGGNGGAGTSGSAGSGGGVNVSATVAQTNVLATPFAALAGICGYLGAVQEIGFGAGGGGGGSDASSNAGGGGGGGGGVIGIWAWAIVNNSTITVAGGNGGNGAAGNAGGGGGGSGGAILGYSLSAWTAGTMTISGGNAGNKASGGTGSNGNSGGSGLALNVVVA